MGLPTPGVVARDTAPEAKLENSENLIGGGWFGGKWEGSGAGGRNMLRGLWSTVVWGA